MTIRHGRRVPQHLYWQAGEEPSDDDRPVATYVESAMAEVAVEAYALYDRAFVGTGLDETTVNPVLDALGAAYEQGRLVGTAEQRERLARWLNTAAVRLQSRYWYGLHHGTIGWHDRDSRPKDNPLRYRVGDLTRKSRRERHDAWLYDAAVDATLREVGATLDMLAVAVRKGELPS